MDLSILEGGLTKKISPVDKLKINNQGGTTSLWKNAEGVEMDTLEVSENGLYFAFGDDLYAYDEIVVDVEEASEEEKEKGKTITGKDPTTGCDVAIGTDEDGNLTEEFIPAKIHIVVPPRKRHYLEDETIDFSGIHVYLMKDDNTRFTSEDYPTGEIPFGELIFPVTVAEADSHSQTTDGGWFYDEYGENFSFCTIPSGMVIEGNYPSDIYGDRMYKVFGEGTLYATNCIAHTYGDGYYDIIVSSKDPFYYLIISGQGASDHHNDAGAISNGYYAVFQSKIAQGSNASITSCGSQHEDTTDMAHDMFTQGDEEATGTQEVPVRWMRPQDGETLEDTFEITVGEEGEDEEQADPYKGSYDFEYNGHRYNYNRSNFSGMYYQNGYIWVNDLALPYTVEDAEGYGLVIRL